ncbi:MAG TPA: peptide MFS transporter [Gemmatimonadaceae bacterium]|nr:peptide MFS transporter [Gemmatimonadaceae bacterium]
MSRTNAAVADITETAGVATDRPTVFDDRALFGQPRGLGLLFITEMWERFSYYGMRAILVLYLVNALKWDTARAANLYGTYTMLAFLTPVIGGYLADRFIGTRRSLVIGAVIISAGHLVLAIPGMTAFYTGLALIIAGTGFFKSNVSTMVGQIYREGDPRRDSGFTIFYMGINTGAFLGPLVCGGLAQSDRFGWHWGFAAAGVGMILGLIGYLWGRDKYLPGIGIGTKSASRDGTAAVSAAPVTADAAAAAGANPVIHGAIGAVGGAIVGWLIASGNYLGVLMGLIVGAAVGVTVLGSRGEERRRVIALFIVVFFVIFFWAAYEQAGSSMNLFADKNTDLHVGSRAIPSSWFQSVNPAVILIFAPTFAWLWGALGRANREPSTALKMALGLFLLGGGFVFMMIGGRRADAGVLVSPLWLVAAYTFHTWGELCLSPVGLSYVSKVAPWRFAGLLMGVWFLANAVANKLAGALAAFTPVPGEAPAARASGLAGYVQSVSQTNFGFYSIFVVSSLAAAVLMLAFVPMLKGLTRSVKA